jgi:hypothetical protein
MTRSTPNIKRSAALAAVVALSLTAAGKRHQYSPREKAAYADAATVDFVRPGLSIAINQAQIASNGTITVMYTLTDPNGLSLDAGGVTTPGAISLGYIAAVLPSNQADYTAYTTRANSGPAVSTTNQPAPILAALLPADRTNINTSSIRRRRPGSIRPPPTRSASMLPAC